MNFCFLSPAHNSEAWIKRMLDSIPKEYAYEIIVCDDDSIDRTAEILEKYQHTCPQLIVLKNGENRGASHSYNQCIEEAT